MRALTCASYDYVRNAVFDLQRQLDELNASSRQQQANNTAVVDPSQTQAAAAAQLRPHQRLNPFNMNTDELPDVFPQTSFEHQNASGAKSRTFEEMHYDFGERVLAAMTVSSSDDSEQAPKAVKRATTICVE